MTARKATARQQRQGQGKGKGNGNRKQRKGNGNRNGNRNRNRNQNQIQGSFAALRITAKMSKSKSKNKGITSFPSVRWFAGRMGVSSEVAAWLGCGEGGVGFEHDGAGEEDVVFQVHVLTEIVLELLEAGVEDAVAEADAVGWREVVA